MLRWWEGPDVAVFSGKSCSHRVSVGRQLEDKAEGSWRGEVAVGVGLCGIGGGWWMKEGGFSGSGTGVGGKWLAEGGIASPNKGDLDWLLFLACSCCSATRNVTRTPRAARIDPRCHWSGAWPRFAGVASSRRHDDVRLRFQLIGGTRGRGRGDASNSDGIQRCADSSRGAGTGVAFCS